MPQALPAVASFLAIGIGSVTIGSILANVAIGLALNYVAGLFIKKQTQSGAVIDSGLNVPNIDPNAPFPFIFGRSLFAGVVRFRELSNNNQWLHMVNVYAAHEIDAVEEIIVDGETVSVDEDGWVSGTYAGKLRVKVYLGTPDQEADSYLLANAPSYTASMRGRGLAYAAISAMWDTDLFAQMPVVQLVMRGVKVFDPRDEAHDLMDGTTWAWSKNAVLCQAHYMRGMPKIDAAGKLRRLFGTNAKDDAIDWNLIAAEANICDEPRALAEGGTQAQYTCNGILMADTEPESGLNSLLTASAGMRIDTGGKLGLLAGAERLPELDFDVGDILAPMQINLKRPLSSLYNAVKGQLRGPDTNYEPDDAPVFIDEALVLLDGRERWLDCTLPFTDNAAAAQRIQRQALSENRRQISAVFVFGLKAMRLKCGDWFTFTNPARGWDAQTFRVKRWQFKLIKPDSEDDAPFFGVEIEAEEVDGGIWAWSSDDQAIVLPPVNVNLPNPLVAPLPTMNVPELIEFRDRALYRLSATPAADGPPVKYRFEVRPKGASVWSVQPDRIDPECDVSLDVGVYQARVKSIVQPYGGQSLYAPASVGLEFTVGVPPLTPRVTGLELVGGGADGTFTGRDAPFRWNEGRVGSTGFENPLGADLDQADPYFAGYGVEIRTLPTLAYPEGQILRYVQITDARFEYTFDLNFRDSRRLGLRGAQRAFRISVTQLGRYGAGLEYSLPQVMDVSNPAPAVPLDLNVRAVVSDLRVTYTPEADPDYEGTIVWGSLTPGFDPATVAPLFIGRSNFIIEPLTPDAVWYVRVAAYDAFIGDYDASDVALLEISGEVELHTQSLLVATDIPKFSFVGLNIRPNTGGTGVEWDAGTATVKTNESTDAYVIAAGSAAWAAGELFVWYQAGLSVLSTGTNIDDMLGAQKVQLATYRGAKDITAGDGGPLIDGNRMILGSLIAGALRTDTAYITNGAQIGSLVVGDANIAELSATKLKANSVITNKLYVGSSQNIEVDGTTGVERMVWNETV